jgi:hypothetical protein
MSVQPEQREDLKRVYQTIFDAFSIPTSEIADTLKGINTRYARELCGTLQHADLIILTEDGEGSDAWQVNNPGTYDDHEWSEASAVFDEWAGIPQTPTTATSPGASSRSSLKSAETGPHPCACGCGEVITTRSVYRPGHDARHAGQIGREIAANYATKGFDRRRLLEYLPTAALVAKAERIAENATRQSESRRQRQESAAATNPRPTWKDGIVKVGKGEYPAKRAVDGKVVYYKDDKELVASKTAAKSFVEG